MHLLPVVYHKLLAIGTQKNITYLKSILTIVNIYAPSRSYANAYASFSTSFTFCAVSRLVSIPYPPSASTPAYPCADILLLILNLV